MGPCPFIHMTNFYAENAVQKSCLSFLKKSWLVDLRIWNDGIVSDDAKDGSIH